MRDDQTLQLDDRPGDFPRIDARLAGLDARYGYVGRTRRWDEVEAEFDGVIRHDLHAGTSITAGYGPDALAGEPVYAPNADDIAEDAGFVLNWVYDRREGTSSMVVLAASTLEELARVRAPRRVPFGFHGSFFPAGA